MTLVDLRLAFETIVRPFLNVEIFDSADGDLAFWSTPEDLDSLTWPQRLQYRMFNSIFHANITSDNAYLLFLGIRDRASSVLYQNRTRLQQWRHDIDDTGNLLYYNPWLVTRIIGISNANPAVPDDWNAFLDLLAVGMQELLDEIVTKDLFAINPENYLASISAEIALYQQLRIAGLATEHAYYENVTNQLQAIITQLRTTLSYITRGFDLVSSNMKYFG
jgi:hypothetical protein